MWIYVYVYVRLFVFSQKQDTECVQYVAWCSIGQFGNDTDNIRNFSSYEIVKIYSNKF